MNTWVMIGAVAVAVVGGWAFVLPKAASGYEVKAMSAKEMTQAKAVIVDIRRPDEWAATGVIKGAKLITFTDQASFLAQLGPVPAGSPLVIICQSGRRSGAAAAALQEIWMGQLSPTRAVCRHGLRIKGKSQNRKCKEGAPYAPSTP